MLAFLNLMSPMHLLVIAIVLLLLFGNRLPEVMRALGRSINEFKRGMSDVDDNLRNPSAPPPAGKLGAPKEPTAAVKQNEPEQVER